MAKKIDKNEIVEVRNLSDRKTITQANAMINSKYSLNLNKFLKFKFFSFGVKPFSNISIYLGRRKLRFYGGLRSRIMTFCQ